jgi:hypothetical protein
MAKSKEKSMFVKNLEKARNVQEDRKLSLEDRQENRYKKVEVIFEELVGKKNRYLLYCPDIPFACSLVKIVYEYAKQMIDLGYDARVLHEEKGFKPNWLDLDWVKDVKVDYLSTPKESKSPEYKFKPSDTVIVPDGFFSIMKSFYEIKPLHKVVLALGYNGLATMEPGVNWGTLGFKDVICISDGIKKQYEKTLPGLNYYTSSYLINDDLLEPVDIKEIKPVIGLMARDRELAAKIINIFTNKYPFFSYFQFKILKKLSVKKYCEELRTCSVLVFADDKSAIPAPIVETIKSQIPVITHENRFLENFKGIDSINVVEVNDEFGFADMLAKFCEVWSSVSTNDFKGISIEGEALLEQFSEKNLKTSVSKIMNTLQEEKIKVFSAIEKKIEAGELENTETLKSL